MQPDKQGRFFPSESPERRSGRQATISDSVVVLTGSFNFTKAAEDRNAENLLVIHGTALAEKYQKNWEAHRAHSEDYAGN